MEAGNGGEVSVIDVLASSWSAVALREAGWGGRGEGGCRAVHTRPYVGPHFSPCLFLLLGARLRAR